MAKVIHVQRYKADPKGFGGSHRLYQTYQNIVASAGESEVAVVEYNQASGGSSSHLNKYRALINEKIDCISRGFKVKFDPEELSRSLVFGQISSSNPFGTFPLEVYKQHIKVHGKPRVVVLDYPNLIEIAKYNNSQGIANIYCPQNLESIYTIVQKTGEFKVAYKSALQWIVEQEMLSICQERLMISPLECEFVRGLGLSAVEYPYLPVNEVRSTLMRIRDDRKQECLEPGLLIMIGTVKQSSTQAGFRWFLDHVKENELPEGVHVVVGGIGGEQLFADYGNVAGVELSGRLDQDELEELMKKAYAVIVPQFSGFGSPTRVCEMACAGIPVLTTSHMTSAMHVPPGVKILSDSWSEWISELKNMTKSLPPNSKPAYEEWEKAQLSPLPGILNKYCT